MEQIQEIDGLKQQYESRYGLYKKLLDETLYIINTGLEQTPVKIHSVFGRVKTYDSVAKKAKSKQHLDEADILSSISDIVGIRVICLFMSDISKIADVIRASFNILAQDNKIDGSELSSFGYFSVHFIGKINEDYVGPRYNDIKNSVIEIQVRTISMDAWANMSHYLDYKTDYDIPTELKRDFFALSGLFYVAEKHFELFYLNKRKQAEIAKEDLEANKNIEVNYETVEAFINKEFPKFVKASPASISNLVGELSALGVRTVQEIEELVDRGTQVTGNMEDFSDFLDQVGVVRAVLIEANKDYAPLLERLYPKKKVD